MIIVFFSYNIPVLAVSLVSQWLSLFRDLLIGCFSLLFTGISLSFSRPVNEEWGDYEEEWQVNKEMQEYAMLSPCLPHSPYPRLCRSEPVVRRWKWRRKTWKVIGRMCPGTRSTLLLSISSLLPSSRFATLVGHSFHSPHYGSEAMIREARNSRIIWVKPTERYQISPSFVHIIFAWRHQSLWPWE